MKKHLTLSFALVLCLSGLLNAAERDRRDSRDRERPRSGEWRDLSEPGKQWQLLGKREVDYRGDTDRINVEDGARREGKFKKLQVRVDGAPIEIRKMIVVFENGEKFNAITERRRLDENSRTLEVDLPGDGRRDIKSIEVNYFSVSRREGTGTMLVYAR